MTSPAPQDELPIRLSLENGDELVWPSTDDLRELLGRIGGDGDHFVILERVPHLPRCFMQTYRDSGADFELEYRDGDGLQFQTHVAEPGDLLRTMTAWALRDPGWKSAHDWVPAFQHVPDEIEPLDEATAASARDHAWEQIDTGFDDFDTIARNISETAEPSAPISLEQAAALLEPLWLKRVAEQETWPVVTDVDRIDNAFVRLDDSGITARLDFACCLRCGTGEIRDEAGPQDRGYVFFHNQDTLHALGGELRLAFGAYSGDPAEAVAIGHEIDAALHAEGLKTEWSGSVDERIAVVGLDWKNRLE